MTQADYKFQGDRVEVDLQTRIVTARGNVILDQGPARVAAETIVIPRSLSWSIQSICVEPSSTSPRE